MKIQQIKIEENLVLHYDKGRLCSIKKPLDKIEINIYESGLKFFYKDGELHKIETKYCCKIKL